MMTESESAHVGCDVSVPQCVAIAAWMWVRSSVRRAFGGAASGARASNGWIGSPSVPMLRAWGRWAAGIRGSAHGVHGERVATD